MVGSGLLGFGIGAGKMPMPLLLLEWRLPLVGHMTFEDNEFHETDSAGSMIKQSDSFDRLLSESFVRELLSQLQPVRLIALPRPLPQVALGTAAHCGGPLGPGTFGVHVDRSGTKGVLTAGHVCPLLKGQPVRAYEPSGVEVGIVTQRMCYQYDTNGNKIPAGTDVADVAFIQLSDQSEPAHSLTAAPAKEWDVVTAHGSVTSGLSSHLQAVGCSMASVSPDCGNWGEAMLTQHAISAGGDSGAAVLNRSGQVVGQVVAGYPGVYTVIQDIEYLLRATGAVLR